MRLIAFIILYCAQTCVFSLPCFAQEVAPEFRESGAGLWSERGRKSELVVVVELRSAKNNLLTLTIRPINGIPRRFSAAVKAQDANSCELELTSYGKQPASGLVHIALQSGSMRMLVGSAIVDGNRVLFQFTTKRPLHWNSVASGVGRFHFGDMDSTISAIFLITAADGTSDIFLVLAPNKFFHIRGQERPASDTNTAEFEVLSHESTEATGSLTCRRDPRSHTFVTAMGSGSVGERTFSIRFSAGKESDD